MPRRGFVPKREVLPDPVHGTTVVTKLINQIMLDGKRGVAQNVCYEAFDTIKEKTGKDANEVFQAALANVAPFDIDYQADNHRTDNADKQIQRVNARQGVFKGCGKSLCDIQYLCRNIRAGGKPHRLSDFIKEIDKEHIGDIRKY